MTVSEIEQALAGSAAAVLESMFFSGLVDGPEPPVLPDEPWMAARLSFHGNPSGRFGVRLPLATARRLAANFLGADEEALTEGQAGEVICELANMLCGSVLSRLEKDARFELSHPELSVPAPAESAPGTPAPASAATRLLNLEEGPMALWLEL